MMLRPGFLNDLREADTVQETHQLLERTERDLLE
jgi:hypothetical protein